MYSRTATQFDLMMKTIMIVLFVIGLFVFFVDVTKAAQWVNNPANCATQSPGGEVVCQTSETPDSRVCGVSGVQYYCFSSVAVFSAPGYTQNNNQDRSGLGGGYIMDCEANDSAPPSGPFCDNNTAFWCNSDDTCNSKYRTTQCSASKWAYEASSFSCTDCISTRLDCSGDDVCEVIKGATTSSTVPNANYGNTCNSVVCKSGYENCDANWSNGCEIQFNVSTCTTGGGEPGVWTACGVCTALPPKYFLTASNTDYYSDNALLWGTQLGSGDLISFSNATSSNIFVVKNDASVFMSSTLATTTDKYFYNYNGDLYWGDEKLNTGGGVYTAGDGLNLAGYEFTIDTSTDFNWTGQHTFNTTTTFPNGVWGTDGKVGIGTTTPTSSLSLVVGDYDGITLFDTTGQMAAGLGAGGVANAGLSLFNRVSGDMSISFNSDFHSWINNNYNFGIGTNTPMTKLSVKTDVPQDGIAVFDDDDNMVIGFGADQTGSGALGIYNSSSAVVPAIILNGDGISYINNNNNFGIGTTTPIFALDIDGDGSFIARSLTKNPFITGYEGTTLTESGVGAKTFYYARKSAFRTGGILDLSVFPEETFEYLFSGDIDQWDETNIGLTSFAANVNTKASGLASTAFGVFTTASGTASFVGGGTGNIAGENAGVIAGRDNQALNWHSFVGGGYENTTLGWASVVVGGKNNTSTGEYSFIGGGEYNEAIGRSSVAFGEQMRVQGENSFGINLFSGSVSSTLIENNTLAIMGGSVGIGTTTPQHTLTLAGDFDIAKNGLLRFNGISGSIDQIIKINALGFPEWVDVNSLFVNNTTFNSSTEFNSTSTFNSTAIFEGPSYFNNDVFVSGTISSTNLYVSGNSTTTGDMYVLGQAIFHDILPADNLAYTIGTSSFVWKEGWFGKIFTDEIEFTNNWKLTTTTDGGLAFTSSTQVALAMLSTGQVGIGTTTIEANLKLKVDGNIGSNLYCDINGNNCFNPNEFGWSMPITFVSSTFNTISTTPDFATGTHRGYKAANLLCDYAFPGSHFCATDEILEYIRLQGTKDLSGFVAGMGNGDINGSWIAEGPPGYAAPANDCSGWTVSSTGYGPFWVADLNGGKGFLSPCTQIKPLTCCK